MRQVAYPAPAIDPLTVLEAALLCTGQPMSVADMRALYEPGVDEWQIQAWLEQLQSDWQYRGLELVQVAGGWRFQSRAQLQPYLARIKPEAPPRYSRAAMEILAVIAYRQPVTRGDIEEIRGIAVNAQIIRSLQDRGWIEVIGQRDAPGQPSLFATTAGFLADMGLDSLRDLPEIEAVGEADLQRQGLEQGPLPAAEEQEQEQEQGAAGPAEDSGSGPT